MKYLLLALPILLAACESTPRTFVASEDKTVVVKDRTWTVTQVTVEPPYFRAVRGPDEYFLFSPPSGTKTAQAVAALEGATGCKVIKSTFYRNVSDQFFAQMDCGANPDVVSDKIVIAKKPL